MPRGRKRKIGNFIPRPWIPNSSSEDEHNGQLLNHLPGMKSNIIPISLLTDKKYIKIFYFIKCSFICYFLEYDQILDHDNLLGDRGDRGDHGDRGPDLQEDAQQFVGGEHIAELEEDVDLRGQVREEDVDLRGQVLEEDDDLRGQVLEEDDQLPGAEQEVYIVMQSNDDDDDDDDEDDDMHYFDEEIVLTPDDILDVFGGREGIVGVENVAPVHVAAEAPVVEDDVHSVAEAPVVEEDDAEDPVDGENDEGDVGMLSKQTLLS